MQIWQKCTSRNESNRRTDFNNFIEVIFFTPATNVANGRDVLQKRLPAYKTKA
jgi:hypothetical protein